MKLTRKWMVVSSLTLAFFLMVPLANANAAFPIGIFYNPGPNDTTDARYAEIANMNANFIVGTNYVDTYAENDLALSFAENHGLKMLVDDGRLKWKSKQLLSQSTMNQSLQVSASSPLGQTFTPSTSTSMLGISTAKLRLGVPNLPANVTVTLTVYNNPGKTYTFYSKSITGPVTGDMLTFDFYQAIGHGGTFYMELTSSSTVAVPISASTADSYAGGQAYVNGVAQTGDLWFETDISDMVYNDGQRPSNAVLDKIALHYKNNPAVMGYNIFDEPTADRFLKVKETVHRLKLQHPLNKSFVNLLPVEAFNPLTGLNLSDPVNFTGAFVSSTNPLGQTFKTGASQTKIANILLYLDHSSWNGDEKLTLKLWNSPQKQTLIAERSRAGSDDLWVSFELNASVTAATSYYWELTHNGGGNNSVGWVVRSNNGVSWDPNGNAYINGILMDSDFAFVLTSQRIVTAEELYEDYVNDWITLNPDVLAFDNYPFKTTHDLMSSYYTNLEVIRRQAQLGSDDFWSYIQSVGITSGYLRTPTQDEIRYQIYTNLAYGAIGIIYFTYWTPQANWGFHDGLILENGTENSSYTWAKNINSEVLKLGPTLQSLISQAVYHTGDLPESTTVLPASFQWKPSNPSSNVIISYFKNASGRKYIMTVNRDHHNSATLTFNVNPKPTAVTEISKTTGLEVSINYNSSTGVISAAFAPGEGRLYVLSTDEPGGLLTNHSFEDGVTGWTNYNTSTLTSVTTPVSSGSKALKITARGSNYTGVQQDIKDLLQNYGQGTYDFGAKLRTESGTQTMYANIHINDSTGNHWFNGSFVSVGSGNWVSSTGTANLTWTGTLNYARIYTESQSGTGNYYVDDFSLKKQ